MSYIKDLRAELIELFDTHLPDAPREARDAIVNVAVDRVFECYKNGVTKGREPVAKPSARPRNPRPLART